MVIALDELWVWDSWYAQDGKNWHAFFLQAPKSIIDPELRHWNVSVGHAVSNDLLNWEYKGTCFAPSTTPSWDDYTTWTGSIVRDESGLWHLFYTGSSKSENGLYQRIGHATSNDLHNWERVGNGQCLDLAGYNAEHYEVQHLKEIWHDRAMRDPWVMKNPYEDGWLMYFTARIANEEEPNAGGAIGFASSGDLYNWRLNKPIFSGGFGQLEVPQVFEIKGKWYCLFCTVADHYSKETLSNSLFPPQSGTHYLISNHPNGPWSLAPGPFFDGNNPCRRYAARVVESNGILLLIGFRDQKSDGNFGGYIMDPVQIKIDENNLLRVANEK